MANPHSKRRKEKRHGPKLRQRLTARWVPIYLAADLAILAVLYFLYPLARVILVGTAQWYWPVIYIPFASLIYFERSDAPFVFNKMMKAWRLAAYSILLTLILLGIREFLVTTLPLEFSPCTVQPETSFFGAILSATHAGLSEEPFKAFGVNGIALVLQHRFRFRVGKRSLDYQLSIKRDMIWIGGIISVGIWALLHVPLACFHVFDFTIAFAIGLVLFVALVRTCDLRLIIVAHVLYNLLAPTFSLSPFL